MMLRLFNLEYISKVVPVMYYDNLTDSLSISATDEIKIQISKEKMGMFKDAKDITLSTMTDEKPEFRNLFFNEDKFKSILKSYTNVSELYPVRITEYENFIRLHLDEKDESIYIDTEYLVNTIPMTFFKDLLHSDTYDIYNRRYEYESIVFVSFNTNEPDAMIYTYNNCFYKRVFFKNGRGCIEIDSIDWDENKFKELFPHIKNYKVTTIPYGRIRTLKVPDTLRIKHVGRFAQWDHSITTEHVINKLINLNL